MNANIRKILESIRTNKHTSTLMSNPPQTKHSYTIDESDIEKFAQLIVEECLNRVDIIRDGFEADNNAPEALGADFAGLAIARHFGVEE
jgi:hypothetical protein